MDLASELLAGITTDQGAGQNARLRRGVVTAVAPALLVRVGAAATAVPATALSTYVPVVGDVVSLLEINGDRLLLGTSVATTWQVPTLGNGWSDFDAGNQTARYRRVGDLVTVQGVVKSGTLGAAVFTLATGYRPPAALQLGTVTNGAFGLLTVTAAGDVVVQSSSNVYASLNCTFPVT